MSSVDGKLDKIIERLGKMPEHSDMRNYLFIALALFVAVATLLIGGMGWLETRAGRVQPATQVTPTAPAPVIIQVPYPAGANQAKGPHG